MALEPWRREKIVLAAFSGSSKTILWPIIKLLRERGERYGAVREAVAGVIFDSSPIEFRADEGRDFFPEFALKNVPRAVKPVIDLPFRGFSLALDRVMRTEITRQHRSYWHDLANPPFDAPILVLYSHRDRLVKSETIQKFLFMMKARGKEDVTAVEFEESEHVNHIVKHKDAYCAHLRKFITQHTQQHSRL